MSGGLSECNIPQSLYAGVVFAGYAEHFESLYRTAGEWWALKAFTSNIPTKTSYPYHAIATAHWQLTKSPTSTWGGTTRPAVYRCIAVWELLNFTQAPLIKIKNFFFHRARRILFSKKNGGRIPEAEGPRDDYSLYPLFPHNCVDSLQTPCGKTFFHKLRWKTPSFFNIRCGSAKPCDFSVFFAFPQVFSL